MIRNVKMVQTSLRSARQTGIMNCCHENELHDPLDIPKLLWLGGQAELNGLDDDELEVGRVCDVDLVILHLVIVTSVQLGFSWGLCWAWQNFTYIHMNCKYLKDVGNKVCLNNLLCPVIINSDQVLGQRSGKLVSSIHIWKDDVCVP